jgi:carboxypeptidase Q
MQQIECLWAGRIVSVAVLALFTWTTSQADTCVSPETRIAVRQLVGDILVNGKAYDYDRELADGIGPRLIGTPNYNKSVTWAVEQFRALGLKNIHTESFKMPASWEPETPAHGRITAPREHDLHIFSAGWSPSTPEGGISGQVVYLKTIPTEAQLPAERARVAGSSRPVGTGVQPFPKARVVVRDDR